MTVSDLNRKESIQSSETYRPKRPAEEMVEESSCEQRWKEGEGSVSDEAVQFQVRQFQFQFQFQLQRLHHQPAARLLRGVSSRCPPD
jgi:hypothetical protein